MPENFNESHVDVVVVGAGASGLTAAQALRARGIRVVVLEAGSKVGGRVLADESLAGAARELGPEFVHGETSNKLIELIERGMRARPAAKLVELQWPNYFYMGKEGRLISAVEAEALPEIGAMDEAFEALGEMETSATEERSLLQYFASAGVDSRVIDLADAIYANDYGAVASDIGLRETVHEQRNWKHGEKCALRRSRAPARPGSPIPTPTAVTVSQSLSQSLSQSFSLSLSLARSLSHFSLPHYFFSPSLPCFLPPSLH